MRFALRVPQCPSWALESIHSGKAEDTNAVPHDRELGGVEYSEGGIVVGAVASATESL